MWLSIYDALYSVSILRFSFIRWTDSSVRIQSFYLSSLAFCHVIVVDQMNSGLLQCHRSVSARVK